MGEPARCRSCGAEISWATSPTGTLMPLDGQPTTDGNLAVHRDTRGDLHARPLKAGEEPLEHERRGMSHFATCPNAAAHRRRPGPPP